VSAKNEAIRRTRDAYWAARRASVKARRAQLITRARASAALRSATLELDIAPDVFVGHNVRIDIWRGTKNRLIIGPGVRLNDDVIIWLHGGSVEIGAHTGLRRGATLNVNGDLRIGADVTLSWGTMVHCAERVEIGDHTLVAEYVTIVDSVHPRTPLDVNARSFTRTKPVRIGRNAFIGVHAMVAYGVTIGDGAWVGGGAVVTKDVPAFWLAAGNPATPVRELEIEDPRGTP
jgi:acetyltransferase-like isoleucine patch superfamily enzyme